VCPKKLQCNLTLHSSPCRAPKRQLQQQLVSGRTKAVSSRDIGRLPGAARLYAPLSQVNHAATHPLGLRHSRPESESDCGCPQNNATRSADEAEGILALC